MPFLDVGEGGLSPVCQARRLPPFVFSHAANRAALLPWIWPKNMVACFSRFPPYEISPQPPSKTFFSLVSDDLSWIRPGER